MEQKESEETNICATYGSVRQALLQDLYQHLAEHGFDLTAFNSVDKDEIFVCISLKDEAQLKHLLQRESMPLHIRKEVVSKLGIDQPQDEKESSPPAITYD